MTTNDTHENLTPEDEIVLSEEADRLLESGQINYSQAVIKTLGQRGVDLVNGKREADAPPVKDGSKKFSKKPSLRPRTQRELRSSDIGRSWHERVGPKWEQQD